MNISLNPYLARTVGNFYGATNDQNLWIYLDVVKNLISGIKEGHRLVERFGFGWSLIR